MTENFHNAALLFTCDEMAVADRYTIRHGTAGTTLMERAGRGVADVCESVWRGADTKGAILVLCGPGNNGGDGYVAARRLAMQGLPVRVAQLGAVSKLKGDAAIAQGKWLGDIEEFKDLSLEGVSLIIDALFGAGLNKAIEGIAAHLIEQINDASIPVVAVDVPSGLSGDSGSVIGAVLNAGHTVTFALKKPGHLLYPGRALCGELHIIDIGINPDCYAKIKPKTFENLPALWIDSLPQERVDQHKYTRGHVMVLGSIAPMLGACRLSALAALRTGSGLVTLMAPKKTYEIQATALDDVMVVNMAGQNSFLQRLKDVRITAVAMGPGAGVGPETRDLVLKTLAVERATVLDADALTSFVDQPSMLFDAIKGPAVFTPHAGEFHRLFPDLDYGGGDKLAIARTAAKRSGAVVILKGPDTVIASPCGRAAINSNAPSHLSVGGTGDVLTGMVAALTGRAMPAFESACAAVWLHSRAAESYSLGMTASDLLLNIPSALLDVTKTGQKTP